LAESNATATLSSAGSVFDWVGSGSGPQQNFPGGFGGIDVCLFADGCSGGNVNNGLQAGASDSFASHAERQVFRADGIVVLSREVSDLGGFFRAWR
jgi:hypothetical protein